MDNEDDVDLVGVEEQHPAGTPFQSGLQKGNTDASVLVVRRWKFPGPQAALLYKHPRVDQFMPLATSITPGALVPHFTLLLETG